MMPPHSPFSRQKRCFSLDQSVKCWHNAPDWQNKSGLVINLAHTLTCRLCGVSRSLWWCVEINLEFDWLTPETVDGGSRRCARQRDRCTRFYRDAYTPYETTEMFKAAVMRCEGMPWHWNFIQNNEIWRSGLQSNCTLSNWTLNGSDLFNERSLSCSSIDRTCYMNGIRPQNNRRSGSVD